MSLGSFPFVATVRLLGSLATSPPTRGRGIFLAAPQAREQRCCEPLQRAGRRLAEQVDKRSLGPSARGHLRHASHPLELATLPLVARFGGAVALGVARFTDPQENLLSFREPCEPLARSRIAAMLVRMPHGREHAIGLFDCGFGGFALKA